MARDLTTALANEFGKERIAPIVLVEAQFLSGMVRLWSGIGDLSWNGHTWNGIGLPNGLVLGFISQMMETTDLQANGVTLTLTGVPRDAVQQVQDECKQNYPASIYIGAVDPDTIAIVLDPYKAFAGTTDVPTIAIGAETATVSITVESALIDLQRAREWRFTNEDQQIYYPGDKGFEFVGAMQNMSLTWGAGGGNPIGGTGSGGGGGKLDGGGRRRNLE